MNELLPGINAAPNLHPMLIHFPIVLWLTALLCWSIGVFGRRDNVFRVGTWLLTLGTVAALFALLTGYLAADAMGHDSPGHDLVHVHRNFMFITTIAATVVTATACLLRARKSPPVRWGLLLGLVAVNGVMLLGADRGVLLVYGYGMGTRTVEVPASSGHAHGDGDHGHDDGGHNAEHSAPAAGHESIPHAH